MTGPENHPQPASGRRTRRLMKIFSVAAFAAGGIVILCFLALLLHPDPIVNGVVKPRLIAALAKAYPAYAVRMGNLSYGVWNNRLVADSVALSALDGSRATTIGTCSVSGIGWVRLLLGGYPMAGIAGDAVIEARDVFLADTRAHYECRCGLIRLSVPDSDAIVEDVALHPPGDDETYFRTSALRVTRFRLAIPHARATGIALCALFEGSMVRVRSARIDHASLDLLLNKDKPNATGEPSPPMLGAFLASMKTALRVDSLRIADGRLTYCERFAVGAKPATITFDAIDVSADGISNEPGGAVPLVIRARTTFAKAGTMTLLLSIPVASPGLTFHYSGSLSGMDLRALNPFLEVSDHVRIKAGVLQTVSYEIDVVSGRASGTVRGIYRDLTLAAIDPKSGSETGISNRIISFIANTFKIRRSNAPDRTGSMRAGIVNYTRERDDTFIRFIWFALRTGVRDAIGL